MGKFNKSNKKRPTKRRSPKNGTNKDIKSKSLTDKEDTYEKRSSNNDSKWYTGDSALTFDAGRFNWFVPNGTTLDVIPYSNKFTIPGVLAMKVVPSVGVSTDNNSVVNVAARKLYTWIRRSKSSYATYDPSDLMQYLIAVGHAYMFHNWMTRVYGLLNVYSQLNRYIPDALLAANGIDPDDMRKDMADFLFYINKYGSQLSSLAVPTTLPYFSRLTWMYSNVYTDDMTGKSTMFEFVPAGWFIYSETTASLVWTSHSAVDLEAIITLGDTILTSILTSQDFWNISADILNAYGSDVLTTVGVPNDYVVLPTFNLEVLSQIQNAVLCGDPSVTQHAMDITQDATTGALLFNPRFPTSETNVTMRKGCQSILTHARKLVNMYKDQVTPDDVFVATRLTPTFHTIDGTTFLQSSGTEFISNATFYFYEVQGDDTRVLDFITFNRCVWAGNMASTLENSQWTRIRKIISMLSQTSYHPYVIMCTTTGSGNSEVFSTGRMIGDVANFTVMDNDDLAKLHTSALFSLFNVPTLGAFKG